MIRLELQKLYVALTRARKTCWIFEEGDKAGALKVGSPSTLSSTNLTSPLVQLYLSTWKVIKIAIPGESLPKIAGALVRLSSRSLELTVGTATGTSTVEEWKELAKSLFQQQLYQEAAQSFHKAKEPVEASIAIAFAARQRAQLLARSAGLAKSAFAEPARLFTLAANAVGTGKRARQLHLQAAECWLLEKKHIKAGRAFEAGLDFENAAKAFRNGGDFTNAVRICKLDEHGDKVKPKTSELIVEVKR